jgi:hypothetical protein
MCLVCTTQDALCTSLSSYKLNHISEFRVCDKSWAPDPISENYTVDLSFLIIYNP